MPSALARVASVLVLLCYSQNVLDGRRVTRRPTWITLTTSPCSRGGGRYVAPRPVPCTRSRPRPRPPRLRPRPRPLHRLPCAISSSFPISHQLASLSSLLFSSLLFSSLLFSSLLFSFLLPPSLLSFPLLSSHLISFPLISSPLLCSALLSSSFLPFFLVSSRLASPPITIPSPISSLSVITRSSLESHPPPTTMASSSQCSNKRGSFDGALQSIPDRGARLDYSRSLPFLSVAVISRGFFFGHPRLFFSIISPLVYIVSPSSLLHCQTNRTFWPQLFNCETVQTLFFFNFKTNKTLSSFLLCTNCSISRQSINAKHTRRSAYA